METMSITLLFVGLFLFLASTRQWKFWLRLAIWIGGAAAMIAAAVLIGSDAGHSGLLRAAADFLDNWRHPADSVIAQALSRNGPSVGRFILPLLDIFLMLATTMGLLALAALTPGQALERTSRPIMIGVAGAIFGAALSLFIVGTGFGAPLNQRTYANFVAPNDIHDGDTFWIGETSVRLLNVDAPERDQTCQRGGEFERCGDAATEHLRELLDGALVLCEVSENGRGRTRESFGRPLVTCRAQIDGRSFNVGTQMIRDGFAVHFDSGAPSPSALSRRIGIMATCTLTPRVWRNDRRAREAFIRNGSLPEAASSRVGDCSNPPPSPLPSRAPPAAP